jgi:hypothetical protein
MFHHIVKREKGRERERELSPLLSHIYTTNTINIYTRAKGISYYHPYHSTKSEHNQERANIISRENVLRNFNPNFVREAV